MFVDLGSGVGRLVAQARLELPPERMARCVGVELSPSRHDLATSGWASLTADGAAAGGEEAAGVGALELRCESMSEAGLGEVDPMQARCRPDAGGLGLKARRRVGRCRASPNPPHLTAPHPTRLETDLADVTHIYVASLCMGDELLDALWARLRSGSAPHLRVFASLREVRCTLHTVYTACCMYTAYSPRRRSCTSADHSLRRAPTVSHATGARRSSVH